MGLTLSIIAIGIVALVGTLTALDSFKASVASTFEKIGASNYSITFIIGKPPITYTQAKSFVENFEEESILTLYTTIGQDVSVSSAGKKTSPTISVLATDAHYLDYHLLKLSKGRNFNTSEITQGKSVCLIGSGVQKSLFGFDAQCLGSKIRLADFDYYVIGVIDGEGRGVSGSFDAQVLVPIESARSKFLTDLSDYVIGILPQVSDLDTEQEICDITQLFRGIRRLSPYEESDFEVHSSDSIFKDMQQITSSLTIASIVIGLVTLLASTIGLMNIMLVSVKERVMEIGVRRALGASAKSIKQQFLWESILIGQAGGLVGIILGILVGNLVAVAMDAEFVMPWLWIAFALVLCLLISIAAGYAPAREASAIDPIEAIRQEG